MGQQDAELAPGERRRRSCTKALLDDLRALELMLDVDLIESGVRRVGSEQEMLLVHSDLGPALVAVSDPCTENITPGPRYHEWPGVRLTVSPLAAPRR